MLRVGMGDHGADFCHARRCSNTVDRYDHARPPTYCRDLILEYIYYGIRTQVQQLVGKKKL